MVTNIMKYLTVFYCAGVVVFCASKPTLPNSDLLWKGNENYVLTVSEVSNRLATKIGQIMPANIGMNTWD